MLPKMGCYYCVVGKSHKKCPKCFRCVESLKLPQPPKGTLSADVSRIWKIWIIYAPFSSPVFQAKPAGGSNDNLPAIQGTWVRSLGQEDPLEKETATHSSILAWEIPWTEEPGGLQSLGSHKSGTQLSDWHFHFLSCRVLDLTYKWYHVVFVFLFLIYFT